jgi:hypothetical protein
MIILDFPIGWYPYLLLWLIFYFALPPWKKDYKGSLKFGALGTCLGIFVEVLAAFFGLWTYTGGNWPIVLWLAYFIASMMWFQLYRFFGALKIKGFWKAFRG